MDVEGMHAHCAAKPGAWPDNPWEHEHPLFEVGPGERGKIFAFLGAHGVVAAVDESYRRVVAGLPKEASPEGWEA